MCGRRRRSRAAEGAQELRLLAHAGLGRRPAASGLARAGAGWRGLAQAGGHSWGLLHAPAGLHCTACDPASGCSKPATPPLPGAGAGWSWRLGRSRTAAWVAARTATTRGFWRETPLRHAPGRVWLWVGGGRGTGLPAPHRLLPATADALPPLLPCPLRCQQFDFEDSEGEDDEDDYSDW